MRVEQPGAAQLETGLAGNPAQLLRAPGCCLHVCCILLLLLLVERLFCAVSLSQQICCADAVLVVCYAARTLCWSGLLGCVCFVYLWLCFFPWAVFLALGDACFGIATTCTVMSGS